MLKSPLIERVLRLCDEAQEQLELINSPYAALLEGDLHMHRAAHLSWWTAPGGTV